MVSSKAMILRYARALWRRRWYAAGVAWVFCLAGWALVLSLPNSYEATARIYVDTESMLRPLMRGIAVDSNILTQVDMLQRTLLSRPNLQRVTHMADLDLSASSPVELEEVISSLRLHTTVVGDGHNLFTITYTGPSRENATQVVQSLLTVFVENNLGNSRQDIDSAKTFIDEQLRQYTQQLDEQDRRIADFKAKNIGYLPGENNYGSKLQQARDDMAKLQAELDDDKNQRAVLAQQLQSVPRVVESIAGAGEFGAGPPISIGPVGSSGAGDAATRVAELEKKLRTLLENYTEQHPDVVRTKKLLEQAKQEAAATPADASAAPVTGIKTTQPNPVYDQIQIQMVTLDTTIASLQSKLKRVQAEADKWQGLAKEVPEIGAQLQKLTRDYDVTKKAYDELLNRRESAKIGGELQSQTQTVQFRIVDPPAAPLVPVAPKRTLMLVVILFGGIISGAGVAFMLMQIDDTIATVRELKELVPIPVLGSISFINTASEKRVLFISNLKFYAASAGLLIAFFGILTLQRLAGGGA